MFNRTLDVTKTTRHAKAKKKIFLMYKLKEEYIATWIINKRVCISFTDRPISVEQPLGDRSRFPYRHIRTYSLFELLYHWLSKAKSSDTRIIHTLTSRSSTVRSRKPMSDFSAHWTCFSIHCLVYFRHGHVASVPHAMCAISNWYQCLLWSLYWTHLFRTEDSYLP